MQNKFTPDKQNIVSFSLMGPESGGPCLVDSTDERITRIRPYFYDTEYTDKHCNPWTMEARGKTFSAPDHVTITPFGLGYKSRVYSPNRVRYPLKRVDWDPNGERHPENRGKSKYVRISWDEAIKYVADQYVSITKKYGSQAFVTGSWGSFSENIHGEGKNVAPSHGCPNRLLSLMGGYTLQMRNMDSWEGWFWGAKYVWGCEPVGEMAPQTNLYPDIAKHSDMLLFWGCAPRLRHESAEPALLLVHGAGHQERLHLSRPQLRRGGACGQVDSHPAEHGRCAAACHRLYLDHGRSLRKRIYRKARLRL